MTTKTLAFVLTLAASAAPLLHATDAAPFNWSGAVSAGKTISVHGISGTITAERSTSGQVEIVALRSGERSDPNEVQIQVVPTSDGLKVCAVYPSSGSDCNGSNSGDRNGHDRNDVKVQFTVKVPAGVNFAGHNVNGDVEIADIQGDATAHTVNGNVKINATESVEAHTVNGNIVATVSGPNANKTMGFHTVNGSIDLTLPGAASAAVSANTVNGAMSTDFPITVKGEFGNKSLAGTIGSGGPEIKMNTVNGSIRLHRG
ncbi:MAG TPA: DUF4097 family beta strand repeat-containing protein [Bryobacteraceae bacterium]